MSRTCSPITMSPDQSHQHRHVATSCSSSPRDHVTDITSCDAAAMSTATEPETETVSPTSMDTEDPHEKGDYFRPLKRLRMKEPEMITAREDFNCKGTCSSNSATGNGGASQTQRLPTSFSIKDILSSKSKKSMPTPAPPIIGLIQAPLLAREQHVMRIVRPWDLRDDDRSHEHVQRRYSRNSAFRLSNSSLDGDDVEIDVDVTETEVDADDDEDIEVDDDYGELDNDSRASLESHEDERATRNNNVIVTSHKNKNDSPLDALFQMTSKAFEGLNNGHNSNSDPSGRDHLHIFSSRPSAKKKRKSRTAFTNHQIFELEKRFLYQKYLSPADRDEIAQSLGLTNAQVITWFQNRRAKLKRDMEELKKDVDSSKTALQPHHHQHQQQQHSLPVHVHHPHARTVAPPPLIGVQDLSLMKITSSPDLIIRRDSQTSQTTASSTLLLQATQRPPPPHSHATTATVTQIQLSH